MEKKAQNITITTIIIIVLALVVLVVLILAFTGSWGQLWGRITSFFGQPNVDTIIQACGVACTAGGTYDYCERPRTLKWEDKDEKLRQATVSCAQLAAGGNVGDKDGKIAILPSVQLSCDIDCGSEPETETCEDLDGEWVIPQPGVSCSTKDLTPQVTAASELSKVEEGQLCCKKEETTE